MSHLVEYGNLVSEVSAYGDSLVNPTECEGGTMTRTYAVANADRLRFFGLLSRYSGLFTELSLDEEEKEESSG